MKKKILITGASGFIGSFLVEEALSKGYEVYAGIRRSSNKQFLNLSAVNLLEMDFSSEESLKKVLTVAPHFDIIIHNAGITKAKKKSEYSLVNYTYTKHFIDALISTKKNPTKFILISSLTAYGPGNPLTLEPVDSHHNPTPITAYGRSKLQAEKYLTGLENFPYLIFRPTAVYGPREKDLYLYFKIINRGMETYIGAPIPYLTFIFVKDLVHVVFLGIESDKINKAYFVADGNVYSGKLLADYLKQHLNKKTLRLTVPIPLVRTIAFFLEALYGIRGNTPILNSEKINELSVKNWKCNTLPLEQDFNFKAQYNLNDGISETVKWYKQEKWL